MFRFTAHPNLAPVVPIWHNVKSQIAEFGRKLRHRADILGVLAVVVSCALPVEATADAVRDNFTLNFIQYVGFGTGTNKLLRFGGSFSPSTGTTVVAVQGQSSTNIGFNPSTGLFLKLFPYDGNLTGSWTLTASNPNLSPTTVSTQAILPSVVAFLNSSSNTDSVLPSTIRAGSGSSPIISWYLPSDFGVPSGTTYSPRLMITDAAGHVVDDGTNGVFLLEPANLEFCVFECLTSVTYFPLGNSHSLNFGQTYYVDAESWFNDSATGLLQATVERPGNVLVPSRAPFDSIYFPQQTDTGFTWNSFVIGGEQVVLDPVVAIGYDFQIGSGDPTFASVELPDLGAFQYSLSLWDGADYVFDTFLSPNTQFFFPTGVDRFRVTGIDPSLLIDPQDAGAFPVTLSFTSTGKFTGTMTPLTANVPEPATFALLGIGLVGLATARMRKSGRREASSRAITSE